MKTIIDRHKDVVLELYKEGIVSCYIFEYNDIFHEFEYLMPIYGKMKAYQILSMKYERSESMIRLIINKMRRSATDDC